GGKLIGDFTLTKLDDEGFLLIGSGIAEEYHLRWFSEHLEQDMDVQLIPQSNTMLGLAVAGPKSRELMQKVTGLDFSTKVFKFMSMKQVPVGLVDCLVGRVSYTGDLGYEIWMEAYNQRTVFECLLREGEEFGIGLFGIRALNSLRLEKNYGSWVREFRPIYSPLEAGLGPFVAYEKEADFIGKKEALKERDEGGKLRLRTFVVDARDADVIGDEPIWFESEVKGWVTSGGYAHASGVSVAMGYVPKEIADEEKGWEIEILDERRASKLQKQPIFDPDGLIMRG
ncbi:uncharacterized protein METZ01_LOCUS247871, partial [marine metagenome]